MHPFLLLGSTETYKSKILVPIGWDIQNMQKFDVYILLMGYSEKSFKNYLSFVLEAPVYT